MSQSSYPPSGGKTAAKYGSGVIGLVTAIATLTAKFSAVEERQEAMNQAIVELRQERDRLTSRVSTLERDREMLERVHAIELKLSSVSDRVQELQQTAVRKRR